MMFWGERQKREKKKKCERIEERNKLKFVIRKIKKRKKNRVEIHKEERGIRFSWKLKKKGVIYYEREEQKEL